MGVVLPTAAFRQGRLHKPLEMLEDALIKPLDAENDTEADDAAALSHEQ